GGECGGADARHPRAAVGGGVGRGEEGRRRTLVGVAPGGDGEEVGVAEAVDAEGGVDGETRRGVERWRLDGTHREVVAGEAVGGAVVAEDLGEDAELEGGDMVGDGDGDVPEHGGQYGRKLSIVGASATFGNRPWTRMNDRSCLCATQPGWAAMAATAPVSTLRVDAWRVSTPAASRVVRLRRGSMPASWRISSL